MGINEESYDEFRGKLLENGYYTYTLRWLNVSPNELTALAPGDWMIYASFKPINRAFEFPDKKLKLRTPQAYTEDYGEIFVALPLDNQGKIKVPQYKHAIKNPVFWLTNIKWDNVNRLSIDLGNIFENIQIPQRQRANDGKKR